MESYVTKDRVFLRDNRGSAMFVPDTMQLFSIDLPETVNMSDLLQLQTTKKQESCIDDDNDDLLNLSYREALLPIIASKETLISAGIKPKINRLTLNVSNSCNLSCSYCYADHGTYHSPASFMSEKTATEIVAQILNMYRNVEIVHFFGGEPLLNPKAIEVICNAFKKAHAEGAIEELPKFVATTNGTVNTPETIALLKKWTIELTVSWDGPKSVQDKTRPMSKKNASSYDKLIDTIDHYQANEIPFEIECTYSCTHIESDVSVVDLMYFFHAKTGLSNFHITPASLPNHSSIDADNPQQVFLGKSLAVQVNSNIPTDKLILLYREAAALTVKNMFSANGPRLAFASSLVDQICKQRKSSIYCPAFFNQLSIAIDGTVYPCFMFIGDKRFSLGNILTDGFPNQQADQVAKMYFEEFGLSPVGTNKWFASLFSGCIAADFIATNRMEQRTTESLYEAIIEECLLGVSLYWDGDASVVNY